MKFGDSLLHLFHRLDTFILNGKNVGRIKRANIRHDNSWLGPGWFLEKVRKTFALYVVTLRLQSRRCKSKNVLLFGKFFNLEIALKPSELR